MTLLEKRKVVTTYVGDKMEDEQYRKIIEEIGQCRFLQDKIAIIKEQIHALADLEDVLLDAELTGEEIQAVLRELVLAELAALAKKYPPTPEIDMAELRETEQILTKSLHDFVSALPQEQQDMIAKAIKAIEEK